MWFSDDPVICISILIWMVKAPKIRYLTHNTTLWIRYFGHPNMMKRTHIFLVLALIVIITVKMSNGSRRRSSSSSSSSRRRSSAIRNTVRTRRIIDTRRSIRTRRIRLPRSEYFLSMVVKYIPTIFLIIYRIRKRFCKFNWNINVDNEKFQQILTIQLKTYLSY